MGEIRVKVSFRNELDVSLNACGKLPKNRVRAIDAEAVVDTGAALLLLPQELVASLRTVDRPSGPRKIGPHMRSPQADADA